MRDPHARGAHPPRRFACIRTERLASPPGRGCVVDLSRGFLGLRVAGLPVGPTWRCFPRCQHPAVCSTVRGEASSPAQRRRCAQGTQIFFIIILFLFWNSSKQELGRIRLTRRGATRGHLVLQRSCPNGLHANQFHK